MSTVQEIEAAIQRLPDAEVLALVDRLRERHAEAWDRQIESDVNAGRLDFLVQEAQAELRQGQTKPLDEVLGNE
jgi:hypothetical protein